MFDNFTLCPGGAFMLHESVAEFDSNMTQAPVEASPADTQVVENIKTELAKAPQDYCPVGALVEKLRPTYQMITNIRREYLDPDTSEEQITLLNKISNAATEIADLMRCILIKQSSFVSFSDRDCTWRYEPLHNHLGWFIKNYSRILGAGYGTYTRSMIYVPGLGPYEVNRACSMYIASCDSLQSTTFDINTLYKITNYNKNDQVFESTEDMFNALFNDPERMGRLTRTTTDSYDLEGIINSTANTCPIDREGDGNIYHADLVRWISKTLRMVKCGCYDCQCDIMDNNLDGSFMSHVRPLVAGVINIFYIGAITLFADAYTIKSIMDNRKSLEAYVTEVMTNLK